MAESGQKEQQQKFKRLFFSITDQRSGPKRGHGVGSLTLMKVNKSVILSSDSSDQVMPEIQLASGKWLSKQKSCHRGWQ